MGRESTTVTENILIGVAWPFPNGSLHLGQIAGAYLPPDIFARYHRMAGNRVAMVSGTDQHGTPIVVRAEQEGKTPQQVVDHFHSEYVRCWEQLGITFDCYTSTGTQNHIDVAQDFFTKLYEKGDIYKATQELTYCEQEGRFLLDRYVEGTCPNCGYEGARGDQCDNCGKVLDPIELLNPRCRFDGTTPTRHETEHFFLKLSAYNDTVKAWLDDGEKEKFWRKPVLNFSLGVLNEGMHDRAITRDLEWGVPIPLDGYDDKRIYVWFENVTRLLSAPPSEWAQEQGTPDAWKDFWHDPSREDLLLHRQGQHLVPRAELARHGLMYGGLNQPYDVPANQYLNFGGAKASTSKGTAPFLPDYLERYDPDTIRYYLSAIMPETNDSEFSEEDLVRRNNEELVSTWGNLVNRVLTMTYRNFDGAIPDPGALREQDEALLAGAEAALAAVGESLSGAKFREALRGCDVVRAGHEPLPQPGRALEDPEGRPSVGRPRPLHGHRLPSKR